jgi:hypothetical protein
VYIVGFVAPFIYAEFSKYGEETGIALTISSITLAGLVLIEALEFMATGRNYFNSVWNYFDLLLFISWYSYYIIKANDDFKLNIVEVLTDPYTNDDIIMNILKVFVITVSFLKIMNYCRAFEGFASLI